MAFWNRFMPSNSHCKIIFIYNSWHGVFLQVLLQFFGFYDKCFVIFFIVIPLMQGCFTIHLF